MGLAATLRKGLRFLLMSFGISVQQEKPAPKTGIKPGPRT